jgi:hypothetical protein
VEAVCAAAPRAWAAHFRGGLALQNYVLGGQRADVYLFLDGFDVDHRVDPEAWANLTETYNLHPLKGGVSL